MTTPQPLAALSRGGRVPNLAAPVSDGRTLLLYEFADGRPLVLGACAPTWSRADGARFLEVVHDAARKRECQSLAIVGAGTEVPSACHDATLVDSDGSLRRRLFGWSPDQSEGAAVVSDPNLRVLEGAAVEPSALHAHAVVAGLLGLIDQSLRDLELEYRAGPQVAPVLVVPRVLSPEVCRGLVASFASWNPVSSPMPTPDGQELVVDPARKSRRDVWIGEPGLEQELFQTISQRVVPEVAKAFQFTARRFERLKLVAYAASDSGHFGVHRDNTAPSTQHRRFALTLNLNAGQYEGGKLAFPEYGPSCAYDPPPGAAIIFSCTHAHRIQPVTEGERYAIVSFMFDAAPEEPPR
ncbi:MAG: 2OG-Fe(II) oxygenase [Myxococcota bacterium]